MFVLPEAAKARATAMGAGWAASLLMGAGQFCTNPGIAVVVEGATADKFVAATKEALAKTGPQVMLTEGIARAYHQGQARMKDRETVRPVTEMVSEGRSANPNLYETTAGQFLADHVLSEEVFGPLGLVVRVETPEEMHRIALSFQGQLTATMHMDEGDLPLAKRLLPVLERKAGRVLVNGYPTGWKWSIPWFTEVPTRLRPISAPPALAPFRSGASCARSAIRIFRRGSCRKVCSSTPFTTCPTGA